MISNKSHVLSLQIFRFGCQTSNNYVTPHHTCQTLVIHCAHYFCNNVQISLHYQPNTTLVFVKINCLLRITIFRIIYMCKNILQENFQITHLLPCKFTELIFLIGHVSTINIKEKYHKLSKIALPTKFNMFITLRMFHIQALSSIKMSPTADIYAVSFNKLIILTTL